MSQQARADVQPSASAMEGNTARALPPGGAPQPSQAPHRRTPLSVVPAGSSRRRTPFVVFCFLTLAAALVGVLVLNVSVSSGQYQLVELHNRQASVAQKNEMLTQEVKNRLAPQNLASDAAELGMVRSPTFGTIDLKTMSVAGNPEAAEDRERPEVLIPAPDVAIQPVPAGPEPAQQEAASDAAKAATPQVREQDRTGGEEDAAGQADSASPASRPDRPTFADTMAPAPVEPKPTDLNGGTIPAPRQQPAQQ